MEMFALRYAVYDGGHVSGICKMRVEYVLIGGYSNNFCIPYILQIKIIQKGFFSKLTYAIAPPIKLKKRYPLTKIIEYAKKI